MKTLIITSQYPLPEIGGNRIRTMNFVRYFKQFGDVDIAYFLEKSPTESADSVFSQEFYFDISGKAKSQSRIREMYERFRYSKPWIVNSFSTKVVNELVDLVEQEEYDYILCRYAVSAYPMLFLPTNNRSKVIVDIDDLMTADLYESVHGTLTGIRRIKSFIDMKIYRKYQLKCAQIGKALVCSELDKKLLSNETASENVYVVPNISPEISLPDTYNRDGYEHLDTMLFVGNLGYSPNIEGLKWFVETIFTRVLMEKPELKLVVIGKDPDPSVKNICCEHANIVLVESPPDVIPFYEQCGVVIVPILSGGGTRIKILEAGRAMRPVLSTPAGAYGLSLHDRQELLYIGDYESFREQINWLNNRINYRKLVTKMSFFVEENFTAEHFDKSLNYVIGINNNTLPKQIIPGLVSVIVPVFNREKLVGRTIESILAQTYPNFEIIAVNDGSTDGSLGVLQEYAEKNPGQIVIIDQQNAGQVRARNNGIQRARGEFIAFLDSDDTWKKQKLSLQIPLFTGNVGLVYCGIHEVSPDGVRLRTVLCDPELHGNIYQHLLVKNRMTGGSVVVSRRALDQVGCFDASFGAAENWDLWIRIAEKFQVDFVNQPLVNYLRHPGNMSYDSERMARSSLEVLQKHLPPSVSQGSLKQTYCQAYANYHYTRAVIAFSSGDYRQARKRFLECWKYMLFYQDSVVRILRTLLGKTANGVLTRIRKSYMTKICQNLIWVQRVGKS